MKANISFSGTGDNTIITAVAGRRICIDHVNLLVSSATNIQLKDGATNYGGAYQLASKGAIALDNVMKNQWGIITLSTNSDFVINSDTAVQVSGFVRFRLVEQS